MPTNGTAPKIVLVVEDEPAIVEVLKCHLDGEGLAVMVARTGEDALEVAFQARLLVVLLDLGLPDIDGFEILRRLKAAKPQLPVIIVTGMKREEEARRAFDLGAWDYVTKPVDFSYLKNVLRLYSQQSAS